MNSVIRTNKTVSETQTRGRIAQQGTLEHRAPRAFGLSGETTKDPRTDSTVTFYCTTYPENHRVSRHYHDRAQLLYAVSGIMTVSTEAGRWSVPPQQAVWIPAGVHHDVHMVSSVEMRSLYILPDTAKQVSRDCTVVEVTPLLRELIARLVADEYTEVAQIERLIAVLIDEVKQLQAPPLYLPMPRDSRLCKITDQLINNTADDSDLVTLAMSAGASARTLARLFKKETGMGFRDWRQQLRLLKAIELLTMGEDVTSVSLTLGYHSPSAFISMFKRTLGTTPGQYLSKVDEQE